MSKVGLIYFTGKGTADETYYAARLLAFTKNTRLQMTPDGFEKFLTLPVEELQAEMDYMSATIASSWEMIDIIFSVNGISRACAQQMTRTRTASYAMQSQRVTDMSSVEFHVPDSVKHKANYQASCEMSLAAYKDAVAAGESLEDARGLLPINAQCNLIAKYNLRAWVDVVRARQSLRVQGEYQEVVRQMRYAVIAAWPWAETFIEPKQSKAISIIEEIAASLPHEQKIKLAKAADLLKKETA